MSGNCAYESAEMNELLGETLRPGGFDLTEKGIEFCQFTVNDRLLDLGCGRGATVKYLDKIHGINAAGIDPSQKLLDVARHYHPAGEFCTGKGEYIPFEDGSFQGVLSECTMSLMDDMIGTLREVYRVLENGGWFFITDVYARKPEQLNQLKEYEFASCMRGLYDLNVLETYLESVGFEVLLKEDHSELLKQLLVKTIFAYGSMDAFWKKTGGACVSGFQQQLKVCRPGYFMMIARKVE